jgi:hypothetical protein
MSISAIGSQSYAVQAMINGFAKNRVSAVTTDSVSTSIGQSRNDAVTISDAAREAVQSAAEDKSSSVREYTQLKIRGLSDNEIKAFRAIREQANESSDAKAFLSLLSQEQRDLVKHANSYGVELSNSHVASMSEEGVM